MAPESIAGEKERGTIATMLITPIRRSDVALGKILANDPKTHDHQHYRHHISLRLLDGLGKGGKDRDHRLAISSPLCYNRATN